MRFGTIALVAAAAITVSCSSTRVNSDWDHQADFGSYSTFSWFDASEPTDPRPTTGASQIVDGRIRRALAQNLTAKGYSETASGEADLEVAYYTSLSSQLRMYNSGWGYGWGYGPRWGYGYSYWPGWNMTTVSTYLEGTIIVDVISREKNQLVWRGVVTSALSKKSSSEEKINKSITKVFADFPSK